MFPIRNVPGSLIFLVDVANRVFSTTFSNCLLLYTDKFLTLIHHFVVPCSPKFSFVSNISSVFS